MCVCVCVCERERAREREREIERYYKSSFFLPQEPTLEHLKEALQTLVAEQQDLSKQAAHSTLSLSRLNQRLVIFERYFIALSRKGLSTRGTEGDGEETKVSIEDEEGLKGDKEKETELPESGSIVHISGGDDDLKKERKSAVENKQPGGLK